MSETTEDWICRASRGDDSAVARLLERYLPSLRVYVDRKLGPVLGAKESASDVVQSCCREVLQHLDRYQYEEEAGFRRWLFATALRKLRDHHRHFAAGKRDVARERFAGDGPSTLHWLKTLATPSRDAMRREDQEKVRALLDKLPEPDQRIITRAYFDQAPHAEIAEELGITVNNTRVRLSRALGKLARQLREEGS